METITSRENAKIKYACAVRDSEKQRAADGLFFAEGPKLCLELAKKLHAACDVRHGGGAGKNARAGPIRPRRDRAHVAEN